MSAAVGGVPPKRMRKSSQERSSFRWTPGIHLRMARYLVHHHEEYKAALMATKKMHFLRKMKEAIGIKGCKDMQLKNGFTHFLRKYDTVKAELELPRGGTDGENHKPVEEAWIKKQCPYFDILDTILGSRPAGELPACPEEMEMPEVEVAIDEVDDDVDAEENAESLYSVATSESEGREKSEEKLPSIETYVKSALKGLGVHKPESSLNSALGVFAQILSTTSGYLAKVEADRMKLEERKFQWEQKYLQEKLDVEKSKIKAEFDLEKERMDEDRKTREFELEKLKTMQQFELNKIKLQIELEKLKQKVFVDLP